MRYYFGLLRDDGKRKPRAVPVDANDGVVAKARDVLAKVEPAKRYRALFIESLRHEVFDPLNDPVATNLQYPPLTLEDVFSDRESVLKRLTSKNKREEDRWLQIDGVFTDRGHYGVLVNLAEAPKILRSERWVVPLTEAEQKEGGLETALKSVASAYEDDYLEAWRAFIGDIYVAPPANLREAVKLYKILLDPERPYIRITRTVQHHTQFTRDLEKVATERATKILIKKFDTEVERRKRGEKLDIDPNKIVGRPSRIPGAFAKVVHFGFGKRGEAPSSVSLAQYGKVLETLREEIVGRLEGQPEAPAESMTEEINRTIKQIESLLSPLDSQTRALLEPLLLTPLNVGGRFLPAK